MGLKGNEVWSRGSIRGHSRTPKCLKCFVLAQSIPDDSARPCKTCRQPRVHESTVSLQVCFWKCQRNARHSSGFCRSHWSRSMVLSRLIQERRAPTCSIWPVSVTVMRRPPGRRKEERHFLWRLKVGFLFLLNRVKGQWREQCWEYWSFEMDFDSYDAQGMKCWMT